MNESSESFRHDFVNSSEEGSPIQNSCDWLTFRQPEQNSVIWPGCSSHKVSHEWLNRIIDQGLRNIFPTGGGGRGTSDLKLGGGALKRLFS